MLNQTFHTTPGSQPEAVIERASEPGTPSEFWNGTAWVPGSATSQPPTVTPTAHPQLGFLGVFQVQVPSSLTALWPDRYYLIHFFSLSGMEKDSIIEQRMVAILAGDDGGLSIPSLSIPAAAAGAASGSIKFWGAAFVPAPAITP